MLVDGYVIADGTNPLRELARERHGSLHPDPCVHFVIVDVFAEHPLTGAPLSLVTDANGLSDIQMQAIAREFNQSETTFLLEPTHPDADWRLRSFTMAGEEVFGAGHNALGAWLWLASSGALDLGNGEVVPDSEGSKPASEGAQFAQQIGDAVLPVHVSRRDGHPIAVSMDQESPRFGATVGDRRGLAAALGLGDDDFVADQDAQVVSTGAGHLLVPVRDRERVDRAAPDAPMLTAALRNVDGEGCYLYTLDTISPDATAYARFFNPTMGIAEDPATGTAAGPLAAALVARGAVSDGSTMIIEQGHSQGRPSRIAVTVTGGSVRVSGSGVVVASGTLSVGG